MPRHTLLSLVAFTRCGRGLSVDAPGATEMQPVCCYDSGFDTDSERRTVAFRRRQTATMVWQPFADRPL